MWRKDGESFNKMGFDSKPRGGLTGGPTPEGLVQTLSSDFLIYFFGAVHARANTPHS